MTASWWYFNSSCVFAELIPIFPLCFLSPYCWSLLTSQMVPFHFPVTCMNLKPCHTTWEETCTVCFFRFWLISLNMTFSSIRFPANDSFSSIFMAGYNSKVYIDGRCVLIGGFLPGGCHDEVGDVSAISQGKICGWCPSTPTHHKETKRAYCVPGSLIDHPAEHSKDRKTCLVSYRIKWEVY